MVKAHGVSRGQLTFLTLPLFVGPWVERRLATSLPTSIDLEDHVVICEFSTRGENLIEELVTQGKPYVIVESDRSRAESLTERGYRVVHGDPEATETLAAVATTDADVLVADAADERNASIVLSAREVSPDVRVIAFVEEPEMADYLRYAGADEVFSPRQLLGETLARQVTTAVRTELGGPSRSATTSTSSSCPSRPTASSPGSA